jgi:hypothetical protein
VLPDEGVENIRTQRTWRSVKCGPSKMQRGKFWLAPKIAVISEGADG